MWSVGLWLYFKQKYHRWSEMNWPIIRLKVFGYKTRYYLAPLNNLLHLTINEWFQWFQNPVIPSIPSRMLTKTRSRKELSRWTEIWSEPNLRPSLTVYTKRNEPISNICSIRASYASNPTRPKTYLVDGHVLAINVSINMTLLCACSLNRSTHV